MQLTITCYVINLLNRTKYKNVLISFSNLLLNILNDQKRLKIAYLNIKISYNTNVWKNIYDIKMKPQ